MPSWLRQARRCASFVWLVLAPCAVRAQQPATPTRAQIRPELVDSTWGRRVNAAYQLAFAGKRAESRAAFDALHREQPLATEPMIGLGFVARAEGKRSEATRWFRAALAVDSASVSARDLLRAAQWDRPRSMDFTVGTAHVGTTNVANWEAGFSTPLTRALSINARGGQIGAGDPFRGIFVDSANGGGARATFVAAGFVARFGGRFTFDARGTRWTSPGQHNDYVHVNLGARVRDGLSLRIGARPVSGGVGAPQVIAAADVRIVQGQSATIEAIQGLRSARFEARSAIRAFYTITPSPRSIYRIVAVRDIDPRNAATTVALSTTQFLRPSIGVRAGASVRRGAFERAAADVGFIVRP